MLSVCKTCCRHAISPASYEFFVGRNVFWRFSGARRQPARHAYGVRANVQWTIIIILRSCFCNVTNVDVVNMTLVRKQPEKNKYTEANSRWYIILLYIVYNYSPEVSHQTAIAQSFDRPRLHAEQWEASAV